uniref:Lymphocyte antigen 6D-like n=1 Tax=Mastacembelus armatus TaxID=205130 RepID=A0A3Q3MIX5_9TELE
MRLFVSLSFILYGLRCYTCWGANPANCNDVRTCPRNYNRCSISGNMITKHCMISAMCENSYSVGVTCCSGDLCNGAKHTGVFVPLLLLPVAIITVFIFET